MQKKESILSKTLAKLNLMEKQLVEETKVLSEIKEREYAYPQELELLKVELNDKERLIENLKEEKKRLQLEAERKAGEFKMALAAERENFQTARAKLESEAAAGEKALQAEILALKNSLFLRNNELEKLNAGLTEEKSGHAILEKKIADSRTTAEELNTSLQNLRSVIKQKDAEISELAKVLEKKAKESDLAFERSREKDERLENLARELEITKNSMETALNEAQKQTYAQKREIEKLAAELNGRARVIADLDDKLKERHAEKENLAAALEERTKALKDFQEQARSEFALRTGQLSDERRKLEERTDSQTRENAGLRAELEDFRSRHAALQQAHEALAKKADELKAVADNLALSLSDSQEARKNENAAARLQLTAEEHQTASLRDELEKQKLTAAGLAEELRNETARFKADLSKEREDFKAACGKLRQEAEAGEKKLFDELQTLKEESSRRNAELNRLTLELAAEKDRHVSLKRELADAAAKHGESALELKNLKAERDNLRKNEKSLLKRADELNAACIHLTLSLKEKEAARKTAEGAATLALAGKEQIISTLARELEQRKLDAEKLAAQLGESGDRETSLARERENLRRKTDELKAEKEKLTFALKDSEETCKNTADSARTELAGRERTIASLGKELEKSRQHNEQLAAELSAKHGEFKAQLSKEREDFKAARDKFEQEAESGEKKLLDEIQLLKEENNHRSAESGRMRLELKDTKDRHDILKKELAEAAARTGELSVELRNLENERDILRKSEESLLKKADELAAANGRLTLSLREEEELRRSADNALELKLAGKEQLLSGLRGELEKQAQENEKLAVQLRSETVQFRTALEKEREEFRLALEKRESETARTERKLTEREIDLQELRDAMGTVVAELKSQRILAKNSQAALAEKEEELLRSRQNMQESEIKSLRSLEQLKEKDGHIGKLAKDLQTMESAIEKSARDLRALEDTHRRDTQKLAIELAAKDQLIAELNREIQEGTEEREKNRLELLNRSAQFKALLSKENKDFSLAYQKMENEFLEREQDFLAESQKFKETLSHKCLETDKLTAEMRELREHRDTLARKLDAAMAEMAEQNVFSKSAHSALKDKEEELTALRSALEQSRRKNRQVPS